MVLRSAGDVGCAHCATMGADRNCPSCTRLVCASCSIRWRTCAEPTVARAVRLGLTARVIDIDPLGTLALVAHWRQPLRVFDLRALAWVPDIALPRELYVRSRFTPPRLTASRAIVHHKVAGLFRRMTWDSLEGGTQDTWLTSLPPRGALQVSATGDRVYYLTDDDQVIMFREPQNGEVTSQTFLPLPAGTRLTAASIDVERNLLLTGTYNQIELHRIDGERLTRLWSRTTNQGMVTWVGIAGKAVVAGIRLGGGAMRFEVRWLDAALEPGPLADAITPNPPWRDIDLAADGRFLAIATDDGLTVHDLDARTATAFADHTDSITCVRFASDDHLLISADSDNRVILRPRTATGYASRVVRVEAM